MLASITFTELLLILAAYLLGSVSSAVMLCRAYGFDDPRSQGSGNPGTTNMLRTTNKTLAILTLLGDTLKGFLPIWVAFHLGYTPSIIGLVGLAAVVGHLYPVFFQFHGGKGVATTLGVCLGINPLLGLVQILCWLAIALPFHISSLGALVTALVTPALTYWLAPEYLLITSVLALIMVYRHRRNLYNLLHGSEPQV